MRRSRIRALAVIALLALADAGVWLATGHAFLSKTTVPVEVYDPLFDATTIEWQSRFVYGLDIAATVLVLLAAAAALAWRRRKQHPTDH